ncbi:MAG: VOC family protein [Gammaproteobacteria bacterium]|nr:VOC family protein [Pseudomonadota bacterium]MCH9663770.1 VOC family protein [Gammaproteobacteria bacterium]
MSKTESVPVPSLRHVALQVRNFDECVDFYTRLVGYQCEWRPDDDNIYLSTGDDNLALHRAAAGTSAEPGGALDHAGFFLASPEQVDELHAWFVVSGVGIEKPPRRHRDGAYSFYCRDPDSNLLQFIYHPPVADRLSIQRRGVDG